MLQLFAVQYTSNKAPKNRKPNLLGKKKNI